MSDQENNDQEAPEAPPALSLDDVKTLVSKSVNSAITQRLSQQEQKLEERLSATVAKAMSDFQPAAPELSDTQLNDHDNEVKTMRARLKEMEALVQAGQKERDQERSLRNVNEERTALKDALMAEGVPADRLKAAVAVLYTEDKRIVRDEDGSIQFATPEEGYIDYSSVRDGVAKYLKSDEGKIYLPARDVAGSGNTGGKPPRNKGDKPSVQDDMLALAEHLMSR